MATDLELLARLPGRGEEWLNVELWSRETHHRLAILEANELVAIWDSDGDRHARLTVEGRMTLARETVPVSLTMGRRPTQTKGSRPERLARAKQLLTQLRDEAQYWLDHRPDGYDNTDDNADRQEKVEAFAEALIAILESFDDLDVPIFQST